MQGHMQEMYRSVQNQQKQQSLSAHAPFDNHAPTVQHHTSQVHTHFCTFLRQAMPLRGVHTVKSQTLQPAHAH
jgi:hypothetical protein